MKNLTTCTLRLCHREGMLMTVSWLVICLQEVTRVQSGIRYFTQFVRSIHIPRFSSSVSSAATNELRS